MQNLLGLPNEGASAQWTDLPLPLPHAVGAATLTCAHGQKADEQPCSDISSARLGCRPLRDGVDAARTCLKVTHEVQEGENQLQMLPMAVDAARFRGLRRLGIDLHPAPNQQSEAHSSVHLEGPPAWLQELQINGSGYRHYKYVQYGSYPMLPLLPSMPQLLSLVLERLRLPPTFDCAQFAVLQQLEVTNCSGLKRLANLASCSSLCVLEIRWCPDLVRGLESSIRPERDRPRCAHRRKTWNSDSCVVMDARQMNVVRTDSLFVLITVIPSPSGTLSQLQQLVLLHTGFTELDVPSLSPSLTYLDVSWTPLQALDLTGCTALVLLSCNEMEQLCSMDLSPVAASLTLLIVHSCDVLTSLNLASCTALQQLMLFTNPVLAQLDLSDCVSLQELEVQYCPVAEVDECSCTALKEVRVKKRFNLRVVGAGPGIRIVES